jgi:hypothetical protein
LHAVLPAGAIFPGFKRIGRAAWLLGVRFAEVLLDGREHLRLQQECSAVYCMYCMRAVQLVVQEFVQCSVRGAVVDEK